MVLTHDNTYQKVLMKHILSTNDDLININDTISTKEHKYYVLDKKYVDIVNDDNIDKYAVFISAEHLTDKYGAVTAKPAVVEVHKLITLVAAWFVEVDPLL